MYGDATNGAVKSPLSSAAYGGKGDVVGGGVDGGGVGGGVDGGGVGGDRGVDGGGGGGGGGDAETRFSLGVVGPIT